MSKEEKELMNSIENEEWVEIDNFEEEKARYEKIAADSLKMDRKVNINLSGRDLEELQRKAIEEGLTYQALIGSVLHKFISGKLVEKDHRS